MGDAGGGQSRVLKAVRSVPGRSVSAIARDLGVDHSTVAYHLRKLERRRAVVGRAVGREHVWFPEGVVCPLLKCHWPTLARLRPEAEAVMGGASSVAEVAACTGTGESASRVRIAALASAGFLERMPRNRWAASRDLVLCLAAMDRGGRCGLWGLCTLSKGPGAWAAEVATPPAG
ncbi:MAG TPA: helix-turn-helix domain-containing protein [Candidatus Thermoplasmatota archaeon]|nr:helix-turn-helix domain-containing protein [Candidatus Thermoplasmatota archaeon]